MQLRGAAGKAPDLERNPALELLRQWVPVSRNVDGEKFFTLGNGKRIATPLLLVIALVGLTGVIFAVLGLRVLVFLLAAVAATFHLLSCGLAVVLLIDVFKIPVAISLGVVTSILAITMLWSVCTAPKIDAKRPQ